MHTDCAQSGCYMFAPDTAERTVCERACRLQSHGLVRAAEATLAQPRVELTPDERSLLQRLVSATKAPNTRRKYLSAWRGFARWAEDRTGTPVTVPVGGDLVLAWVLHRAPDTSPSAVQVDLAAIAAVHVAYGHPAPKHAQLRDVLAGHRRSWLGGRGKAAALRLPELAKISAALAVRPGSDERAARDRAIILVGYAGALRRSEVGAIRVEDLTFEADGAVLRLPRSKTDQEGLGRLVALAAARDHAVCPVVALRRWLQIRGHAPGPLWMRYAGNDRRIGLGALTGETVAAILRQRAREAHVELPRLSGHSLRRGWITEAAAAGAHERDIRAQSGHADTRTLEGYIEEANVLKRAPKVL